MDSMYINAIFSANDIDYMVQHFSENQLKKEKRVAESNAKNQNALLSDDEAYYYQEYADALSLALEIIKSNKCVPKPQPGRIDIEAVKRSNDIVNVIERYTQLRKSGNRFMGRCPFHEDKNPSFVVYPENQSFHCFSCQEHGDVITFIQAVRRCDFKQAASILGG